MAASSTTVLPADSSTRQAWRFGLLCAAFIGLWLVGSAYGLGDASALDTLLCNQLATTGAWGLRALGWVAATDTAQPSLLLLNGQPSVIVGAPCDGLVLYALLAGFVLAYPGPARRRLWFIPLGIAALWLLNIIRIIVLALNHQYSPETFDFDHHYAFNVVAYAALGGLWLLWTRQAAAAAPMAGRPVAGTTLTTSSPTRQSWLSTSILAGAAVLLILISISISQNQVTAILSAGWVDLLAAGPAWLHRLPGATAGSADVPGSVSHLALPVGVAYLGLFVGLAMLALRLLLPSRHWRLVWRCYTALALASVLLIGSGRVTDSPEAYRIGRMVLDFMASLLPVMGLLVLLWRGKAAAPASALPTGEPAR